ncbi:MAG: hypothetical protein HKO65_03525 [Gemmatimonadetes bacterium]|nr:hypothetical protein [Gemmatimonadota bacterium]
MTPLEDRWETLEACEEAVRRRGRVLATTTHLSLVDVEDGKLIRIGAPPRLEFVEWRYGPRSSEESSRPGFWARLLSRLPSPPVGGYDPYKGFEGALRSEPWLASPFLEQASPLTYLFSEVPLAPVCPSCHGPLALRPWEFQRIEILAGPHGPSVLAVCAICDTEVVLDLLEARPVLRVALGIVTPQPVLRQIATGAALEMDAMGGPKALLGSLASARHALGDLGSQARAGLIMTLDELAELEALEAEWRRAEEIAAIMDGELSDIPGFEAFRKNILDRGR